jgi:hypothetical protein
MFAARKLEIGAAIELELSEIARGSAQTARRRSD